MGGRKRPRQSGLWRDGAMWGGFLALVANTSPHHAAALPLWPSFVSPAGQHTRHHISQRASLRSGDRPLERIKQPPSSPHSIARHFSSPSDEFPQLDHHDPEDEWDEWGSASVGFDRRKYSQLGAPPNGRRGMMINTDGDEWEDYADTDDGSGSDDAVEDGFDDFRSLDVSTSIDNAPSDPQTNSQETRNIGRKEEDGRGSDSTSSGIDRGNYQRLGAVPGGRRGIIMSSDEDEWEGYHGMEPGFDNGEEDFGSLNVFNEMKPLPVEKDERHDKAHEPKRNTESAHDAPSSPPHSEAESGESVMDGDRPWVRANNARLANDADGGAHVTYIPNEERAVQLEDEPSVDNFRSQFVATKTANADASANKSVDVKQPKSTRRRIPPEEIEHIKSTISIVDAIESYNLDEFTRTSSRGAKACCPFHDDTNPSMSIDDDRGLYKCFACGAGGDVFNFVREYDYLDKRKGEEKMNYMAAVEYAAREFGDDALVKDWNFANGGGGTFEGLSEEAIEKIRERERKRGRIKEANTAAAAFYTRCLVTLPTAGKARAHLRSRSISPASIRSFSLGYAPDCYYGDEARGSGGRKKWGEGSLVEYLAEEGFTPDEIVEAGLATRTKRKSPQGSDKTNTDDNEEIDYSGLMDRFRSRLIVPIMDEGGRDVIALGGRHLEAAMKDDDDMVDKEESSSFAPAKYINSPDSLAFTKKNVLFNRYGAKLAMEEEPNEDAAASSDEAMTYDVPPAVIIVEGYFDAIALSNVGVRNVVASMGTALPVEQLEIVAKMGNVPGGRIILCMDGDDAGQNAVERICRNDILSKVPDLNRNELYVATLPGGEVKDPSDFVDFAGGGEKAGKRFQDEVLQNAVPWDEWFVDRILARHTEDESDDGGSFSSVCEELSTFLSTFPNPADRTMRAHKAAETLAGLIIARDESNSDSSSSIAMLRVQLESDILNMSSRKAGVREAMERRIEQTDGVAGGATAGRMERLTSGGDATRDDDDRKMSKSSLARAGRPPVSRERVQVARANARASPRPVGAPTNSRRSFRATRNRQRPPEQDLVPHFNGFTFKHESDRDWLGLSRNGKTKPKMHLGETPSTVEERNRLRAETPMFEEDHVVPRRKTQDPVYFNSNSYLGQQYLSPDTVRAGYELGSDRPSSGESIVDFTERRMFEGVDPEQHILQAESRLLHALAKFPHARATMRTVYSTSAFGPSNMRWTSEEREWLFLCLTGSPEIDPPLPAELLDEGTSSQLRACLASREECPHGAFILDLSDDAIDETNAAHQQAVIDASVETSSDPDEHSAGIAGDSSSLGSTSIEVEVVGADDGNELDSFPEPSPAQASTFDDKEGAGLLDEYFLEADEMFPAFSNSKIARETRAELTVQETVATLLRATAKKRFSSAKAKLAIIVSEMDRRDQDEAEGNKDVPANPDFEDVSEDELQEMFCEAGEEVVDAQKSLYESERSSDRVNSHLLDYSVSNGVLYRQGQAELERLDKMMEEHVSSLPEDHHRPETPGNDGTYVFGSDEFDDSGIDPMFGGTNPDDYVVRGLPDGESKFE